MTRSASVWLLIPVLAALAVGCGKEAPTGPSAGGTMQPEQRRSDRGQTSDEQARCSFARGITTCVTVSTEVRETTHAEVSGCMAFNGTTFVPGRRTRTFADVIEVTTTTTTLRHGHHGQVFSTSASTQTHPVSSTLVDEVCASI